MRSPDKSSPVHWIAVGLLAGGAALPLAALAHGDAAQTVEAAPVSSIDGMTVVRDAATGQLRAPTAEEAKALADRRAAGAPAASAARALRSAAPADRPLARVHASGARGARLTDEFMSYSVMVRQPDGSLAEQCFDSREAADAAVKAAAASSARPVTTGNPTE